MQRLRPGSSLAFPARFSHRVTTFLIGGYECRSRAAREVFVELREIPTRSGRAFLLGTTYFDFDAARESVSNVCPVAQRTKLGGWTYLESIGVTH